MLSYNTENWSHEQSPKIYKTYPDVDFKIEFFSRSLATMRMNFEIVIITALQTWI
jgi:hypothetical protein